MFVLNCIEKDKIASFDPKSFQLDELSQSDFNDLMLLIQSGEKKIQGNYGIISNKLVLFYVYQGAIWLKIGEHLFEIDETIQSKSETPQTKELLQTGFPDFWKYSMLVNLSGSKLCKFLLLKNELAIFEFSYKLPLMKLYPFINFNFMAYINNILSSKQHREKILAVWKDD